MLVISSGTIEGMKRHPSKRARTKFSDSSDAADPQQSMIDRSEGPRRKSTETVDPAAAEPPFSSEWDDNEFEVVGPPPRR